MVARATVIIPTFGQAPFSIWAIKSVQAQTVRDIEICILCDGSPENMVSFFRTLAEEDPRIKVFTFPKGPRTGEEHRDVVIRREAQGKIVYYCSHDDLWLPDHIEALEKSLKGCCFVHTIHANIDTPEKIKEGGDLFRDIGYVDVAHDYFSGKMLSGSMSFFGLSNGAHTLESYLSLPEGWTTTPSVPCGILVDHEPIKYPTDLYMWNKFLRAYRGRCKTLAKLTAIHFPVSYTPRRAWTAEQRHDELEFYYKKIQDPFFIDQMRQTVRDFYRRERDYFIDQRRGFVSMIAKKISRRLQRLLRRCE